MYLLHTFAHLEWVCDFIYHLFKKCQARDKMMTARKGAATVRRWLSAAQSLPEHPHLCALTDYLRNPQWLCPAFPPLSRRRPCLVTCFAGYWEFREKAPLRKTNEMKECTLPVGSVQQPLSAFLPPSLHFFAFFPLPSFSWDGCKQYTASSLETLWLVGGVKSISPVHFRCLLVGPVHCVARWRSFPGPAWPAVFGSVGRSLSLACHNLPF